jgi:hypothetical protein
MPMHRRMPSGTSLDSVKLRSPAWMAVPDDDDDEVIEVRTQAATRVGTAWWVIGSLGILGFLLQSQLAPWWFVALVGAETYVVIRRWLDALGGGGGGGGGGSGAGAAGAAGAGGGGGVPSGRRFRHFTSLRLARGAPVDEVVAAFLALDSLECVRSLELGSNLAPTDEASRGHTLGLIVTFAGVAQRATFLKSAERAQFLSFVQPHAEETFVFDFESGAI